MKNFFITGTDTDAGKTIATAALVSLFLQQNIEVRPMKPIQTGCTYRQGTWDIPDLSLVFNATGLSLPQEERELLCTYAFEPACSPHLAAEKSSRTISFAKIIRNYNLLDHPQRVILSEGAGGILVPINREKMMIDLMVEFNDPVVVVTRTGLGTINHTLLTIHELQRIGLTIAGIIFCQTKPPEQEYLEKDNRVIIAQLSGIPILGSLSYRTDMHTLIQSPKAFQAYAQQSLPRAFNILKKR